MTITLQCNARIYGPRCRGSFYFCKLWFFFFFFHLEWNMSRPFGSAMFRPVFGSSSDLKELIILSAHLTLACLSLWQRVWTRPHRRNQHAQGPLARIVWLIWWPVSYQSSEPGDSTMTTIPQPANHRAALYGRKWISGRFRVGGRGPSPRFTTGHTLRVRVCFMAQS